MISYDNPGRLSMQHAVWGVTLSISLDIGEKLKSPLEEVCNQ
jgi:hypothetical protein